MQPNPAAPSGGAVLDRLCPFAPKKHHKNNFLFANNLFPNVYIYGCTKKAAGKRGRAKENTRTQKHCKNNLACHKFASRLSFKAEDSWEALLCSRPRKHRKNKFHSAHPPVSSVYIHGRVRNAGRKRLRRRLPEREPGGKAKEGKHCEHVSCHYPISAGRRGDEGTV